MWISTGSAILFLLVLGASSGLAGYAGHRGRSQVRWAVLSLAGSAGFGLAARAMWQAVVGVPDAGDTLLAGPVILVAALGAPGAVWLALSLLPPGVAIRRNQVRAHRMAGAEGGAGSLQLDIADRVIRFVPDPDQAQSALELPFGDVESVTADGECVAVVVSGRRHTFIIEGASVAVRQHTASALAARSSAQMLAQSVAGHGSKR